MNPTRTRSAGRSALGCLSAIVIVAAGIGLTARTVDAGTTEGCGPRGPSSRSPNWPARFGREPATEWCRDDATYEDGDEVYTFDQWIEHVYTPADRNGDGWFCVRTTKGSQGTGQVVRADRMTPLLAGQHYTITNINDNNSRPL